MSKWYFSGCYILCFTVKYEVYFTLLNSRTQLINLGKACKNMWKAAGNNLVTQANQELTFVKTANSLFTVVQGKGGEDKIDDPPFTQFHGNVFLSSLLFFSKSHYSPLLSLIDERQQFN